MDFLVRPGGCLAGVVRVPGDKSISHRAVMLATLADGASHIGGLLLGEDVLATLDVFRRMGVAIERQDGGAVRVNGVGRDGLRAPAAALDLGNSGTAMRLLAGLLAGQRFASRLVGDASLSRRPMGRVVEPLRQMGAKITSTAQGTPPIDIAPVTRLHGIEYRLPVASAQVKSALLLAGLYASGETTVVEPVPTRDHTERMLATFGYPVRCGASAVTVIGGGSLRPADIEVPGDLSSAAFLMVGATIAPGSDLRIDAVGVNPTRRGVIDILRDMGADIRLLNEREVAGEPVADIAVRSAALHGIEVEKSSVSLAIDEFPAIAVAAAAADGRTVVSGAEELRVKESDRIESVVSGLRAVGIRARETTDGMVIQGGRIEGGSVHSHGDHRIAMAFAVAGLGAAGDIRIADCRNVNTSFPDFVALLRSVGLRIDVC